jgi:replicative DNA helicase
LTEKKKELTPLEIELIKSSKQVQEYKLACEANIVAILYVNPELYFTYDKLNIKSFSNNTWRVYFAIGYDIVVKEGKKSLDDITVGLYLEKHPKLKQKYDEYGGYDTIDKSKEYVNIENIGGYINELNKWNAVLQLLARRFPVHDKIKQFVDMNAESIYDLYEAQLNHVFVNVEGDVQSYNLCEDIHELLEKLDKGENVGMPLYNSPILNKEIGGNLEGHITMLGALSGAGKTTLTIELLLPQILHYNEKVCIMINEEDVSKWRKELIIWVANNIFKKELKKYILRDGGFNAEQWELLKQCADWIEEKKENRNITIIPFPKYTAKLAIKTIKKYSSLGCKWFVLDTMKVSSDAKSDLQWQEMTRDSVEIYDAIKPAGRNVHIWITYQLGKAATTKRYYTNDAIGIAKNIVDVASTNLMIRKPFDDEYEDEKNELKCYRLEGKNKLTKIPFKLDKNKHYTIIFITKNRFGSTNEFQIVAENDLAKNVYKEIGIVKIPLDW